MFFKEILEKTPISKQFLAQIIKSYANSIDKSLKTTSNSENFSLFSRKIQFHIVNYENSITFAPANSFRPAPSESSRVETQQR